MSVFAGDVLIVEDNVIIAMDVEDIVRGLGAADVHLASSVEDALSAIDENRIDAAILDFHLEDGTSEIIGDRLIEKDIRFVFATGYSDTDLLPERFQSCRLLKKPYTANDIREIFQSDA